MELYELKQKHSALEDRIKDIEQLLDVDSLKETIDTIEQKTYRNDFWDNHDEAQKTVQKLNRLKKRYKAYKDLKEGMDNLSVAIELLEMGEEVDSAEEDVDALKAQFDKLETLLYLSESYDDSPAIIEIHPGAGGTESHDWAMMLYRMYTRYAESQGYSLEVNDYLPGSEAGLKNATFTVDGDHAYGKFKAEHGVHRLVRISPFDASKRRHTSFAGVSVIPYIDDNVEVDIKDEDLRVDTYRSSGAGGQSVNTTDSAVRITHLPTEITVSCQNERSQIKNREQAMKILRAKLHQLEQKKRSEEIERLRGEDMSNAFGSQIRSYVMHPYTMVKDHRTEKETSQVEKVLDGDIDDFIMSYLKQVSKEKASDGKDA